jgi:hypothetical protein
MVIVLAVDDQGGKFVGTSGLNAKNEPRAKGKIDEPTGFYECSHRYTELCRIRRQ